MIDLRSDTLTLPSNDMLNTILSAKLGDSGRLGENSRGEDQSVNELENYSCELLGKEAGLFLPSGTMANMVAVLTYCNPGDKVMVDSKQHMLISEKGIFDKKIGKLIPVTYQINESSKIDFKNLEEQIINESPNLITVENTHNFNGGSVLDLDQLEKLRKIANKYNLKIHMDGARLFNASTYLKCNPMDIVKYVDSVMFCLSKGLGAPMGSVLLGTSEFIKNAQNTQALLGGKMRQAGVIAAPGLYALKHNTKKIETDHSNARLFAEKLSDLNLIKIKNPPATNIIILDIDKTNLSQSEFCQMAKDYGLLIRPVLEKNIRLVFHNGIDSNMAKKAGDIIVEMENKILNMR